MRYVVWTVEGLAMAVAAAVIVGAVVDAWNGRRPRFRPLHREPTVLPWRQS